ncbi:MAG: hypothetical protein BWY91_00905 [bacterium ADurb.BinA028]|nr:MAG: hypothetical protein BWY91_00905 [bacterium ADurb.BinA028]
MMVSITLPEPHLSLSAMAKGPAPPVWLARAPGLVLVHSGTPGALQPVVVWVTVQLAGGNGSSKKAASRVTAWEPAGQVGASTVTVAVSLSEALLVPACAVQVAVLVTVALTVAGSMYE